MDSGEKVWARVLWVRPTAQDTSMGFTKTWGPAPDNRAQVSFERGWLFITYPGRTFFDVKPKALVRKDPRTVGVDSGRWRHGYFELEFDSPDDADRVEAELRKLLPTADELAQRRADRRLWVQLSSVLLGLIGYGLARVSCSLVTGAGCDDPTHQLLLAIGLAMILVATAMFVYERAWRSKAW